MDAVWVLSSFAAKGPKSKRRADPADLAEAATGPAPDRRGSMDAGNGRTKRRIVAALLATSISSPVQGQSVPLPGNPGPIGRLNEDVAYSLFLLTNGGFTSAGYVDYQDESTTSKINVYTLPLRLLLETGLLGPVELRLTGGYGEAATTTLQSVTGIAGSPAGALATERHSSHSGICASTSAGRSAPCRIWC
ncbi:hypothetical protein ACFQU2_37405 [Siccirubricoccus deserti]